MNEASLDSLFRDLRDIENEVEAAVTEESEAAHTEADPSPIQKGKEPMSKHHLSPNSDVQLDDFVNKGKVVRKRIEVSYDLICGHSQRFVLTPNQYQKAVVDKEDSKNWHCTGCLQKVLSSFVLQQSSLASLSLGSEHEIQDAIFIRFVELNKLAAAIHSGQYHFHLKRLLFTELMQLVMACEAAFPWLAIEETGLTACFLNPSQVIRLSAFACGQDYHGNLIGYLYHLAKRKEVSIENVVA